MTAIAMHAAPRWRDIAAEQIRAVGIHVKAVGALMVVSMAIYAVVVIRVAVNERNSALAHKLHATSSFAYTPQVSILIAYLALLLPPLIWHDETPTRRTYHLAMPVDRSVHALTKAFAGWVWLMLGTAFFAACIIGVAAIAANIAGPPLGHIPVIEAWEWLVPFTSVTIGYALASAAAIGAETPAVWIIGPPILYAAASMAAGLLGYPDVSKAMLKFFSGYDGAAAAIGGWVDEIDAAGHTIGGASAGRWMEATFIWGVTAAILLIVVARRRGALK